MIVLALPGGAATAAALAKELSCSWSELVVHRFPDGESLVRIDVPVQGRLVLLAGSLHHPDTKALPLIFAADAARELGARQVGLAAPYLAYMRQDRRFHAGEAVTSRTFARLLSSSLDFLVTAAPHLHRWHALGDIYSIPTRVVPTGPAIASWVLSHVPDPLLIGPDEESAQWVDTVARLCAAPWTVLRKVRRGDHEVSVDLPPGVSWAGRTPVLLDDIVSTGSTLLAAVDALRAAGARPPCCVAVHALLNDCALRRLMDAGVTRFASTDSVAATCDAIRLAPYLADAVRACLFPLPERTTS